MRRAFLVSLLAAALGLTTPAFANGDRIILQSTTSTANSGLYDHILPIFTDTTGIEVSVVAVGTGQAIRNAMNCDGDVLLVHARAAEEAFVAEGGGLARYDLMFNDFIIVGPSSDPAGVSGVMDVTSALSQIAEGAHFFASRGDDSGTHMKERTLWSSAQLDPTNASGTWYRETGSGMGATLNIGVGMGAYILTDRASWVTFGNKQGHEVLVEGDERLRNQYGVILVNPDRCPTMKARNGQTFVDWLLSTEGQASIAEFSIEGQQLFFPNAK